MPGVMTRDASPRSSRSARTVEHERGRTDAFTVFVETFRLGTHRMAGLQRVSEVNASEEPQDYKDAFTGVIGTLLEMEDIF